MRTRRFLRRGSWLAAVAVLLLQWSVFAHACDRTGAPAAKCHALSAAASCKAHCEASAPTPGGGLDTPPAPAPGAALPEPAFPPTSGLAHGMLATAPPSPPPTYILLQSYRS